MARPADIAHVVVLLILVFPFCCSAQQNGLSLDQASEQKIIEGFVYFTDSQRLFLKSEPFRFPARLNHHQLGREIVNRLIQGPSKERLEAIWPNTTQVNAFFISDDKDVYVDLKLPSDITAKMDTRSEILAVYSLVNSLTVNIPGVKRVKILLNGKEAKSLAGHLDIEYFYQTNMLIVK